MTASATPAAPTPPVPFRMAGLGRQGLVYGFGMLASRALSFLMLPLYTRYLSPADYGILELVTATIEVVSIVAGARIAGGIFHFYHKAEGEEARRRFLSTALLLLTATYGVVTLATILVAPWVANLAFHGGGADKALLIRIAAATMLLDGILVVPIAFLQLRERPGAFVALQLGKLAMQLVLNVVLLVVFKMGVVAVLISALIANVVAAAWLASALLRDVGVHVNVPVARDLIRFGIPLVGMQVAGFIIAMGDRYFLARGAGEDAVGLYGLAYRFGYLVMYLGYISFHQAWDPARFAIAKRSDRDAIFARVFIYANLMVVTCAVGIGLLGADVIRVMADAKFHSAGGMVPIMVMVFTFHAWSYFHNTGMLVTERTKLITVSHWAAAAVAIAGYILVIPRFGAFGAAWVAVASYGTRFVLLYVFSQRVWTIRYRWGPVWRVVGIAALMCAVAVALPQMGLALSVTVHLFLLALYGAGVWFLGGLSPGDRAPLLRAMRSPRSFLTELKAT